MIESGDKGEHNKPDDTVTTKVRSSNAVPKKRHLITGIESRVAGGFYDLCTSHVLPYIHISSSSNSKNTPRLLGIQLIVRNVADVRFNQLTSERSVDKILVQ